MATNQRVYRAACPNCGAPVEFASAASASAVCSFCRSTLLRDGETLRRIGVVSEVFDDHSPLQLGAVGRLQGQPFTLVGRLQYGYAGGTWNEWHALFDNGPNGPRSGWLSEDNGSFVFAFDTDLPDAAPAFASLQAGQRVLVGGSAWAVASVTRAKLVSAQGELPRPPKLDGEFGVADLRNPQGEVGTLDYADPARPQWSIGRSIAISELAMTGLRDDESAATLRSRALECPSCGAALEPKLGSTKSIACGQCHAVVDISQGAGADLAHHQQNTGAEPQIPLGRSGTLALGGSALPWQVVGYLERCTLPAPGDDEEYFFWREYLLWHRTAGFTFLVDSEDGWSWTRPITGVPRQKGDGAEWNGSFYRLKERYHAKVTWVLGEFYWRLQRDETADVADYAAGQKTLSREAVLGEVTWSAGQALDATVVAKAFGLEAPQALARDVQPQSASGSTLRTVLIIVVVMLLLFALLSRCSSDNCDETRQLFGPSSTEYRQCLANRGSGSSGRSGGGSWGGWSSGGGGHK